MIIIDISANNSFDSVVIVQIFGMEIEVFSHESTDIEEAMIILMPVFVSV